MFKTKKRKASLIQMGICRGIKGRRGIYFHI